MKTLRILALIAALLAPGGAFAQSQVNAGFFWGNPNAGKAPLQPASVTQMLDRALANTRGAIVERGSGGWVAFAPSATARVPYLSGGTGADPLYGVYTLPASATSGGIPYFSSTTAESSSALLTANNVMVGGGAGGAPSTISFAANQIVLGAASGGGLTTAGAGTTTTVFHGGAPGAFGSVVSADLNITTTSCTNQVITAISASAGGTCTSIAFAMLAAGALATGANLEAGAANVLLSAAIIYDGEQTITFNATQTLDFNTFLNGRLTLTANITSLTCSNIKASQSGVITLVQDATGSRTVPAGWCTQFRWAGGARGILSTALSSVDALFYQCVSTSICYVSLSKGQLN